MKNIGILFLAMVIWACSVLLMVLGQTLYEVSDWFILAWTVGAILSMPTINFWADWLHKHLLP